LGQIEVGEWKLNRQTKERFEVGEKLRTAHLFTKCMKHQEGTRLTNAELMEFFGRLFPHARLCWYRRMNKKQQQRDMVCERFLTARALHAPGKTTGRTRVVTYLTDLYRELCDPGYAADHIIGPAKTGDEQVLRLGLSDLITALSMTKST
jgi:hypothetical protein